MADVVWGNIGNALLAGSQAGYNVARGRREAGQEQRREEAQPFYTAAMGGDPAAMAKVASGDPHGATAMATMLSRLDGNKRAEMKAAADYSARGAHAILQSDPADRPAVYRQVIEEGRKLGYQNDLPPEYSPGLDGTLRARRAQAIDINKWFEQEQQNARANPGSTQVDLPGPGGGAPAGAPAGGAPNYGGAIASMESGGLPNGGYAAVGPVANDKGNRAYGKYQVMDFNVGPWTQEILGKPMTPQEFAANPQAQDAVFNGKFGQYVQKYGSPQAAARAWFAGEGGMNNPGAKDVNGTTVAGYEGKFSAALGGQPAQMPGPPQGLVPNATMAQVPGPPQGLVPPGPPIAPMPQVGGPARGTPGPIAQGDTPQADGSGTPLAPQGMPPKPQGPVWDTDPRQFGYVMRGERDRYGNVKPIEIGGALLFRNPQTNEHILYKAKPEKPTGPQGSFSGNAMEAQYANVLENGDPSTFAYAQAYSHFASPRTTVNENGQMVTIQPNVSHIRRPTYQPDGQVPGAAPAIQPPGGQTVSVQTIPEIQANKPMNNEQARDAGFADRMTNSNGIVATVENQGKSGSGRVKEAMPFGMGNFAQSEDYQKFKQARDDFINAQLRRESGAAIGPHEYTNADKQYFPVPGDSDAVIKQKALNRQIAVESMAKGAGPAYKPRVAESAGTGKPLSPEEAAKLPPGTKFIGTDGVERTRH